MLKKFLEPVELIELNFRYMVKIMLKKFLETVKLIKLNFHYGEIMLKKFFGNY
jgi:hypothetical protein